MTGVQTCALPISYVEHGVGHCLVHADGAGQNAAADVGDAGQLQHTLTVNVARLRRKLEKMGLENVILTKKGIGYMVEA